MATKIIKALIDGIVQEIEVEDITSPEQGLSVEDRLIELEDKPIVTDGNFLVGNGTEEMEEITPDEVLSHINGASVMTLTTAEFEALGDNFNANTLYMTTDGESESYTKSEIDNKLSTKSNTNHTHKLDSLTNGYLNTHPEDASNIIPFLYNDLAFLTQRGGSCKIYTTTDTDYTALSLNETSPNIANSKDNIFDGTPSYSFFTLPSANDVVIIDLTLHKQFDYNNKFYIDFGNDWWQAHNIYVYARLSSLETQYTLELSETNNNSGKWQSTLTHKVADDTGEYSRFDELRIVLQGFSHINPRIAQIGLINYSSKGVAETFISRGGCDGIYGSLVPYTNGNADLGSSAKKWNNIYANNIEGANNTYTATIITTWTDSEAPYSQDITVTGITASDNPVVDLTLSGTYLNDQTRLAEWGKIYRIVTASNKITVYATEPTTAELPIQLQVVR